MNNRVYDPVYELKKDMVERLLKIKIFKTFNEGAWPDFQHYICKPIQALQYPNLNVNNLHSKHNNINNLHSHHNNIKNDCLIDLHFHHNIKNNCLNSQVN